MFNKLVDYFLNNSHRFNLRTIRYTTGTIVILYILSNFPPRPPNNYYLLRKY
jgi:hypothetical protein